MAGINLGSFFGGSSSNMFSDYAAIRNGSYKRLLRQYYSEASGSSSKSVSGSTTTSNILDRILEERRHPVESKTVSEANSALTSGVNSLKNSLQKLQKEDTYKAEENKTIEDKTVSALKDFVSSYNSTVEASKKSTNTGITHHVAEMMKATKENAEALSNAGIGIKSDGTLYLNEGKAKTADWTETKELFSNERGNYGYTVNSALTGAGYYTTSSSSSAASVSEKTNESAKETAASFGDLKNNIDALRLAEYDADGVAALVSDFTKNYNSLLSSARLSSNEGVVANLKNLTNRTNENKKALSEIGISVDKNGNLAYDEKKLKAADIVGVKKTLKSYASSIETSASLVKYYATTNAGTSSGYTSNGSYNAFGTSTNYTSPFQA